MDLNSLYQNGMGSLASMQAGQQMAADQQMAAAKLRAQQMENDQNAAMNPLNQQFMQGRIAAQQAELPGIMGVAQTQQAQGQYDTQTLADRIKARISALGNQVGSDKIQQMGREGEIATQTAQMLAQYPPAIHKELAPRIMQMYGVSPDSPLVKGIENLPDGEVARSLASVGSSMALASKDFLTKSAENAQKYDAEKEIARGRDATSTTNAHIMADSRVQAAEKKAQQMFDHMTMNQKIAYLSSRIASGEATDGERAQYIDLNNKIKEQNAARVPTLPNDITGNPRQTDTVKDPGGFDNPAPAPVNIPQGAVQMLKANPHLRAAFDQKYGQGAAAKILGN